MPADTIVGALVIVMIRSALGWLLNAVVVQVAFVPQTMSATVLVLPPVQPAPCVGAPLLVHVPQSLSVTRIVAFAATETPQAEPQPASLKMISILSPGSSVFAKPPDEVSTDEVEVRFVGGGAIPVTVTGT